MNLFIKNIVSTRCKMIVESELENIGIKCVNIEQGRVTISGPITPLQFQEAGISLSQYGFELIENKKTILIERIKHTIIEMINNAEASHKTNFSDYLSSKLDLDYTYLANVFSEVQGLTIEQFIILYKIHMVKQLICQGELNLTEISWKLNYSSVAHLSFQFKKVTGVTPSHFKQMSLQHNPEFANV